MLNWLKKSLILTIMVWSFVDRGLIIICKTASKNPMPIPSRKVMTTEAEKEAIRN